jgi:hypothetical protein
MTDAKYLIWSNEHRAWWRPSHAGYTCLIEGAGRYSRAEAERICQNANEYLQPGAMRHEVLVLAPESLPTEPNDA